MHAPESPNRAERRRRGITRSRLKRSGTIASAGALVSVGLFGAYVGNPRLQRAYAGPLPCISSPEAHVSDDTGLRGALIEPRCTTITVHGGIQVLSDLPTIDDTLWGVARETSGLTIRGANGVGDDTINANSHRGVVISDLAIAAPVPVELSVSDLTITGADGTQGAVFVRTNGDDTVTVTNSAFSDNTADNGAAIYVYTGGGSETVIASGSTFSGNTSANQGGAIFAHTVISNGNTFSDNSAYEGGAISSDGTASSTDDSFRDNSASSGGAVLSSGPVVLDSVVLSQNTAVFRGGGIAVLGSSLTILDSTVSQNRAFLGGGIYSNSAVTVTSSAIVNNEATYEGGGIRGASATVTNSYVGANRANYFGGIWLATGSRHLGLYFSTVYDNKATGFMSYQEIGADLLTAVGSVIASQWTNNTWMATTVDDTAFITDDSLGSWTPGVGSHVLAPGQGLALGTRDDTLIPGHAGRTPLASSPLAVAVADGGFAPATSPRPSVLLDQLGVTRVAPYTIGARQFVAPSPPSPPTPPSVPPSAPGDPRAVAGDRRALVSWVAPASSGSFPVTNYQVVASPGGAQCLATAPALSCTVEGLTNGTVYAFRVKALNGAGWSPESTPSNEVAPHGDPAILIRGSREGREVKVVGATTGIESSTVVPRFRFAGQTEYQTGLVRPTIEASGAFRWSRATSRKIYVYFMADEIRSNRIVIRREG